MNQCLSTCLLFGALLSLPLTAGGQNTNSTTARRSIINGPSFQTEDPTEIVPPRTAHKNRMHIP
jgi:hypothetical protein